MTGLCTVLVCSCDRYADLLPPFITLFRKYWPDCPFPVKLVTETDPGVPGFDGVVACSSGGTWCSRLVQALDAVETPFVLMLCDDYYLEKPVDTALLLQRLGQMRERRALNLRLIPNPVPRNGNAEELSGAEPPLWEYRKRIAYCVATQSGFWDKAFLRRLAAKTDSIWEFERYGSYDFTEDEEQRPLLVTPTREFPFLDAVHKGCWETWGVECLRENGISLNFSRRGLPSMRVRLKEALKRFVWNLNPDLVTRIQNRFALGAKEKSNTGKGRK